VDFDEFVDGHRGNERYPNFLQGDARYETGECTKKQARVGGVCAPKNG
jgi:hypothetical protein